MATVYITEYQAATVMIGGQAVQIPMEPPLVEQSVITLSGSSQQSAAFNAKTEIVSIASDGIHSALFGTNPTVTTANKRFPADVEHWHGVPKGQSFKVAVITNT